MNKLSIKALLVVAIVLFAVPGYALSPTRVGNKNFERGWTQLVHGNRDAAKVQFDKGADAYAEALSGDLRTSYADFTSNLTQAGMSFYYAGRYKEAVEVMGEVYGKDKTVWEASIISALAYAAMGDAKNTEEWLKMFLDSVSSQYIISSEAQKQLKLLTDGSASIDAVAQDLDKVLINQFWYNSTRQASAFGKDKCNGAFWWRYAVKPCTALYNYDRMN